MFDIIVYGVDTLAGLEVLRAVGRIGLRPLVVARNFQAIGLYSIYAQQSLIMPSNPPSAAYLFNLARYRQIKYIIAHDPDDIAYLTHLSASNQLGDIKIIAPSAKLLKKIQNPRTVEKVFSKLKCNSLRFNILKTFEQVDNFAISSNYPIVFFDGHSSNQHKHILYARNFIDFKRQAKNIIDLNHPVHVYPKEYHNLPVNQDHYLIVNNQIEHVWRSQTYLLPFDKYSKDNVISTYYPKGYNNPKVDDTVLKAASLLGFDNEVMTLCYFQRILPSGQPEFIFTDIQIGGAGLDLPLFQYSDVKMIEERLKLYGFHIPKTKSKTRKSSVLMITGTDKYNSIVSSFDPIYGTSPPLKGSSWAFPLYDFNDLRPFLYIVWKYMKIMPMHLYQLIKHTLRHSFLNIMKDKHRDIQQRMLQ